MRSTEDIDLCDLEHFRDGFPHAFFDRLRRQAPVWWHPKTANTPDGEGFWVVSRHAEALGVLLDPATYSSVTGGTRPYGGTFLQDMPLAGSMLNMMDDPRHARIRQLVNKGFTPRIIGRLEDELRRRAIQIVDDVRARGACDFVTDVARELPLQAICMLLGVPQSDRQTLCDWVDEGLEQSDEPGADQQVISRAASQKLAGYAAQLIADKRAKPGEDMFSIVVHATLPGDEVAALSEQELLAFFFLLFTAGSETTRKTIAGALLALIERPEQLAHLQDGRNVTALAIEEMVRWTTPSVYKRRTVTRDVELAGQKLRAGDKITSWEMSANRDEDVFDEPHRFDLARSPNPHIGFGRGVHFCLGASLARMEISVMFETLLPRVREVELAGLPVWTRSNRLFGLKHLPIRYGSTSFG